MEKRRPLTVTLLLCRAVLCVALWTSILGLSGCAGKAAKEREEALASFTKNRDVLLETPATRRYSLAAGNGWIEEWKVVDVTQKGVLKNSEGLKECLCVLKFQVTHWGVQNGAKIEPPVIRAETEERTIPVK